MKKNILFSSHDPGGANVILPIIKEIIKDLENYNIHLLLLSKAREKIDVYIDGIFYININHLKIENFNYEYDVYEEDIVSLFKEISFNLVLTGTSSNSNLEKLIIKNAKINNIPSFSIIDFWANYLKRFTINYETFFPNVIFVTDNRMYKEIKPLLDIDVKLIISGNPHINELVNNFSNLVDKKLKSDNKKIRFFSENIKQHYPEREINEFHIVKTILESFSDLESTMEFIIRPHPLESKDNWIKFIDEFDAVKNLIIRIDNIISFNDVLKEDFISIGISSMALIETSLTGKKTLSYQIGLKKEDYLYLPFSEYEIIEIKSKNDLNNILNENNQIKSINFNHNNAINIIINIIKDV